MTRSRNFYLVWINGTPMHPEQPLTAEEAVAHFQDQDAVAEEGDSVAIKPFDEQHTAGVVL